MFYIFLGSFEKHIMVIEYIVLNINDNFELYTIYSYINGCPNNTRKFSITYLNFGGRFYYFATNVLLGAPIDFR